MPALIRDGAPVQILPGLPFVDAHQVSRPGNWLDYASDTERGEAGVHAIGEPPAPPEGKMHVPTGLALRDGAVVRTYRVEDAAADPVPETISDRQFAQALAKQGIISRDEALAFVKRGEVPKQLQDAIDAIADDEARFDVEMQISGATTFDRSNPSTAALAAAMNWTTEQTDALWRYAASLR